MGGRSNYQTGVVPPAPAMPRPDDFPVPTGPPSLGAVLLSLLNPQRGARPMAPPVKQPPFYRYSPDKPTVPKRTNR